MLAPLSWRTLGLPALWIAVLIGILVYQENRHMRQASQFQEAAIHGQRLDRALREIEDRHLRTMRRTRDALFELRPTNSLAMLRWTSQHYVRDLDLLIKDAQRIAERHPLAHSSDAPRYASDLARLRSQLDKVYMEAQRTGPVFDLLLEAISAGDEGARQAALVDFERCDRGVQGVLRVTSEMVRNITSLQTWQAIQNSWNPLAWTLFIFAIFIPLSFYFSVRPLRRLRHLTLTSQSHIALGPSRSFWQASGDLSQEEKALRLQKDAWLHERNEQATRWHERNLECDRLNLLVRRSEHELALMKFYNENLVNSLRSAIVVTDTTGRITAINRVARALLALDEDAIGKFFRTTQLYRSARGRCADLDKELGSAIEERKALRFEAVPYDDVAHPLLLDLTVAPYQDESGAARGLLFVADDVTDAVQTKHQLLLAERLAAIGRLSAQIAHEIRNPLSAIGLNAELLEEEFAAQLDSSKGAEARQMLHAIGAEIERLTEVTETYLQLARLPQPNIRPVDVNELIADLFIMLGEELKAHDIQLLLDLQTPAPKAALDPGQLRQALLNIVRNSREAMPQGGILRVQTRSSNKHCAIAIFDSGEGIPCDVLSRVFEPFYSTKPYGTGLGLSLTQQIVMEHGGTVNIGPRDGQGTYVIIELPRTQLSKAINTAA